MRPKCAQRGRHGPGLFLAGQQVWGRSVRGRMHALPCMRLRCLVLAQASCQCSLTAMLGLLGLLCGHWWVVTRNRQGGRRQRGRRRVKGKWLWAGCSLPGGAYHLHCQCVLPRSEGVTQLQQMQLGGVAQRERAEGMRRRAAEEALDWRGQVRVQGQVQAGGRGLSGSSQGQELCMVQ